MMRTIANLIGMGRATLVDDSGDLQLVQVTEGTRGGGMGDRITDKVRRVAEFGLATVPPLGSELLLLRLLGERARSLVIGTSHRPSRPREMQPGDTALYDVRGAKVQLTADGVLIDCAGLPCTIQNATAVTIKASGKVRVEAATLEVTGDVVSRADGTPVSLNAIRDAYHAHKHTGVQVGTALSGLTDHDA